MNWLSRFLPGSGPGLDPDQQASLDLAQGPLLRVVLFDLGEDRPARLFLVIHHLAVDGATQLGPVRLEATGYARWLDDLVARAEVKHHYCLNFHSRGAPDEVAAYYESVDRSMTTINAALWTLFMDCVCLQLLPPCPTDPGDDRLTLACMRVQGGRIIEICNFERKQLITIPALLWWLSALPLGPVVSAALERARREQGGKICLFQHQGYLYAPED